MNKLLILLAILAITSCNNCWIARTVDLGNDFILVESDNNHVEVFYSYQLGSKCFNGYKSVIVVPATVISYNYNDKWIVAKSNDPNLNEINYWIIDKECSFYRLEYEKQVKKQTIGPLDSIQYERKLKERNIKLTLKTDK